MRVPAQQRFDFAPQFCVESEGFSQPRRPLTGRAFECGMKEALDPLPAFSLHRFCAVKLDFAFPIQTIYTRAG
jgi:hypothetical protein